MDSLQHAMNTMNLSGQSSLFEERKGASLNREDQLLKIKEKVVRLGGECDEDKISIDSNARSYKIAFTEDLSITDRRIDRVARCASLNQEIADRGSDDRVVAWADRDGKRVYLTSVFSSEDARAILTGKRDGCNEGTEITVHAPRNTSLDDLKMSLRKEARKRCDELNGSEGFLFGDCSYTTNEWGQIERLIPLAIAPTSAYSVLNLNSNWQETSSSGNSNV